MGWASRTGFWICLAAMAALGALEAFHGEALPGLHAYPEATPVWALRASGGVLALAAMATLAAPRFGGLVLASTWVVACAFALAAALASPGNLLGYVPVAETTMFAMFALWRSSGARAWTAIRIVFGAMLLLFGVIHLTNREVIASLIPEWMPGVGIWPWITGGGSALAGLACLAGRLVGLAAGAVALMYASWLPLVHATRLIGDPASLFEWTFALTAVALAGVALAIAGYEPAMTAVSVWAPHSAQEPS
jgi:hypothetical protein